MSNNKIIIEFTPNEARILSRIIQSHSPAVEDEMIAIMLYTRIIGKLKEKNE